MENDKQNNIHYKAIHLLSTHKFPQFRPTHAPCTHKWWRHYDKQYIGVRMVLDSPTPLVRTL